MIQQSPEWWAAKRGKATASRIGDLMQRNKPKKGQTVGEWSARRQNYLREKVAERITGRNRDRKKVASLEHRLELEPEARAAYAFYSDVPVELTLVGFIDHPRIPNAGASPDSLVNDDGGLELKCLDPETMIDLWLEGGFDEDYIYQSHFGIACTERKWWDLAAYCPEMPEEGKLFVQRIERDDIKIAHIEKTVIEFLAEVDEKVAQVRGAMQSKSVLTTQLESSLASLHVVH